jgi:hypothetical protein
MTSVIAVHATVTPLTIHPSMPSLSHLPSLIFLPRSMSCTEGIANETLPRMMQQAMMLL